MPLRALNEGKKWMYQTFAKQPLPSLGLECWGVKNLKKHYQQKEEYEGAPTTGVLFWSIEGSDRGFCIWEIVLQTGC